MRKLRASKINQIAGGVLLMLSLFVSSLAACVCAHHEVQTQTNEHCHSSAENSHHSSETVAAEDHHREASTVINDFAAIAEADCCCVKPTPKVAVKVESYGIETPAAVHTPEKRFEIIRQWRAFSIKIIYRAAPFYLSDSFYNLTPTRGPPSVKA